MSGAAWSSVVHAEVGARLAALGAHHGACRRAPDGTRVVTWWFPAGARRRERRLAFRALDGGLDDWEVEYAELSAPDGAAPRSILVHAARRVRTDRAGLAGAVSDLVVAGLPRRGPAAVVVAETVPRDRSGTGTSGAGVPPGVDGAAPGPAAARAAAAARRPPPPSRGVRVADGLLGVLVAVALLAACRVDIDLAPSIASFAVPLLGVSSVWTLIGLTGAERRR